MITKAKVIKELLQYLGLRWLLFRTWHALRMRSGLIRSQLPATPWSAQPLTDFLREPSLADPDSYLTYRRSQAPPFFFDPADIDGYQACFTNWDIFEESPFIVTDKLAQGWLRYFHHSSKQVGCPPNWHKNPFTGEHAPADLHWSKLSDFSYGDIKIIWEPNRFGFVYPLVRAYWRSGDERYAELFWMLVMDWRENNPPQLGPNWMCGQETSFRVMAWSFGLYGFLEAESTSAERVAALSQMIAVSGMRIESNLRYAMSQRNNHGISEGMGLWTIGALFPEFRKAARWCKKGGNVLESQGRELIYEDGAFSQHSLNYHRLMLHDYLWCLRLGEIVHQPFSTELRQRVEKAVYFLYHLQFGEKGEVPQYGQNDGALILSLNNCDYQDFRPVIQATYYLFKGTRCFESGPWDEDLLWLFGKEALESTVIPPVEEQHQAEDGGYYTFRTDTSAALVRCGNFRHRPSHADMLHLDVWWKGVNIACDPGTFSYNSPAPWNNPFVSTRHHNTVIVDGKDQMDRVSRFLWLPWTRGRVHRQELTDGKIVSWQGEHNGYHRLQFPAEHRRSILQLKPDTVLVFDRLKSAGEHEYRLHWLFFNFPFDWDPESRLLNLHTSNGDYYVQVGALGVNTTITLTIGDSKSPTGWLSRYYSDRIPAISLEVTSNSDELCFWTVLGPEKYRISSDTASIEFCGPEWQATLKPCKKDEAVCLKLEAASMTHRLETLGIEL